MMIIPIQYTSEIRSSRRGEGEGERERERREREKEREGGRKREKEREGEGERERVSIWRGGDDPGINTINTLQLHHFRYSIEKDCS